MDRGGTSSCCTLSGLAAKERTLSAGVEEVGVSIAIFSLAVGWGFSSAADVSCFFIGSGFRSFSSGARVAGIGFLTAVVGRLPLPNHPALVNRMPSALAAGCVIKAYW